jgi:hypothetical protein
MFSKFFYQKKATPSPEYICEFHKYWEENHEIEGRTGWKSGKTGEGGGGGISS